mgnify:CR=1 FL=1
MSAINFKVDVARRPDPDGDRVVVYGRPAFYAGRGSFSLWTTEIRHVGIGDLLARIEKLRAQLAAKKAQQEAANEAARLIADEVVVPAVHLTGARIARGGGHRELHGTGHCGRQHR